ncbi:anthranilate phosphoribosyltransferase [Desulfobacca acetoxidans]|uniref:Anthranilate phosphoribosyltransferase n=1 Tax=Desulfobacca acetoxidans (strain ATCC 700848 / DSM 11109 / ASRB2) TaxID=880072 RepID=F2NIL6_DESAR|nr:anthranilate phosphoribosyltransferase [Desulfobacca acetoxidans]AEB10491.1 Anthranilate phosphoribosyltransferase [Desulfobacca acetoxidans DSM 11109]
MIQELIFKAVNRQDLTASEMTEAMETIMTGQATDAQIGAFITALRMKGETVTEITAAAQVMRAKATRIPISDTLIDLDRDEINIDRETIVDTVGTGGDATNTFNVSTTTAFVVAGAGLKVAKHGNRAVSSRCGSADVIEALGINLALTPEQVGECVREVGIGFLFAPQLHGAMRYAIGPRREIGIRTIFNVLGPLTNPAGANILVVGVYEARLTELLAGVLLNLGTDSAFVVYGEGSFDEISITGPTRVSQLQHGQIKTYTITPEEFGLRRGVLNDIRGGDVFENAKIVRRVLAGEPSPKQDMVALNAAAAFIAAGLTPDFGAGLTLAREVITSGRAQAKLDALIAKSKSFERSA